MVSRGRRYREREEISDRMRHDFDVRHTSPGFRGRGRSPDVRIREESVRNREEPRFHEHDDRRRAFWEEERRRRRSRSRNRDVERSDHRDRRLDSRGRRSRSIERRNEGFRFEPPDRPENRETERRRTLSLERDRKRRHSPEGHRFVEDEHRNKFSPPSEPKRFPESEMQTELWAPMQQNVEPNSSMGSGNQFSQNQSFTGMQGQNLNASGQNLTLNPIENQEPISQGFAQGVGFSSTPNMNENASQNFPENDTPVIPEFNPENTNLTSYEWIRLIEDTGKQRNWKKDEKYYIMTSRLAGFARQWYLTTGINFKIWSDLKLAFFKAFPSEMDFFNLLQKMIARVKEDDESMLTYFHHKVALLNACEIHGKKAVSCLIAGLQNSKLRSQAKGQNCEDPDQLYMFLRSVPDEPLTPKKPKPIDEPKPKSNLASKPLLPTPRQACYNCRQMGHLIAQCPQKREVKKPQPQLNLSHNNVMHGSLSRKMVSPTNFIDVGINGMSVKGYVDQSSAMCTIREEDALGLRLPIRKQYKIVRGFCGSSISSMGIVDITICVDRAMAPVKLYIVPDHIQAIPIIVGQSFVNQSHIVVVKDKDSMRLYQRMENGQTNFELLNMN